MSTFHRRAVDQRPDPANGSGSIKEDCPTLSEKQFGKHLKMPSIGFNGACTVALNSMATILTNSVAHAYVPNIRNAPCVRDRLNEVVLLSRRRMNKIPLCPMPSMCYSKFSLVHTTTPSDDTRVAVAVPTLSPFCKRCEEEEILFNPSHCCDRVDTSFSPASAAPRGASSCPELERNMADARIDNRKPLWARIRNSSLIDCNVCR